MEEKKSVKLEGVRAWYNRTTRTSRRVFIIAAGCTFVAMGLMWTFAPLPVLKRIQEFNGALTLPLCGGLWLYMFIYMFLAPSREASFRGQEALEEGIEFLRGAAKVWEKVGTDISREIPLMKTDQAEVMAKVREISKSVEAALAKNSALVDDARPVLEALKSIEERIDREIKTGVVEDLRLAIDALKTMMPPPGATPRPGTAAKPTEGDLGGALAAIKKKKPEPGSVQVKV